MNSISMSAAPQSRALNVFLLLIAFLVAAGCGGGGSGGGQPPQPPAPTALSYASPQNYVTGQAINALSPTVTGTVASYSISPALPAGLTLDTSTGRISGTPTVSAAQATYIVTATNSSGSTTFSLSLEVLGPTVNASISQVSRIISSGTSVDIAFTLQPVRFTFTDDLYVEASDSAGVFNQPVTATRNGDGSFTVTLTTATSAATALHVSQLTLNLCRASSCATRQTVPSMTLPFTINVMSDTTTWPGNNLSALAAWTGAPDWGTFQGNAGHTGHVPAEANPNDFSTRWSIANTGLSTAFTGQVGTVATGEDRVFTITDSTNTLSALDEFDGHLLWRHDFSDLQFPSVNPPAVTDGTVYIAAGQQWSTYMYAFNAADRNLVFRSPMSSQWENYLAPTVGANGVYSNAGSYGGMYAFDLTGQQLFFSYLAQMASWSPAIDSSGVYAYTGFRLTVVDPLTGTTLHTIQDPSFDHYLYDIGGSAVLGAPGSVFAANYGNSVLNSGTIGNRLINFDVVNDDINWQITGNYPTTPAYDDGVVYATNESPMRIEARNESDGALLWWWTPPHGADTRFESEVLLIDNLLFVSTNRSVYAIDRETHRPVWSYPASGHLALSRNGVLYIETATRLIAINLK